MHFTSFGCHTKILFFFVSVRFILQGPIVNVEFRHEGLFEGDLFEEKGLIKMFYSLQGH